MNQFNNILKHKVEELDSLLLEDRITLLVNRDGITTEAYDTSSLLSMTLGHDCIVTTPGTDYICTLLHIDDEVDIIDDVRYMVLTVGMDD